MRSSPPRAAIRRLQSHSGEARARLLAVPGAGAAPSSFLPWVAWVPDATELWAVQRPGRQDRRREPAHVRVADMVTELLPWVEPLVDRTLTVIGHSMGALVAFELLRKLEVRHPSASLRLVVVAACAPHVPRPRSLMMLEDDAELASVLGGLHGTAPALLADASAREAILPAVRADLAAEASYVLESRTRLSCDIAVAYSEADPLVTPADALGWRSHTNAAFASRAFPGTHFFHQEHPEELMRFICEPQADGAQLEGAA
jgi:pyochelin biosynthetic protein PchC